MGIRSKRMFSGLMSLREGRSDRKQEVVNIEYVEEDRRGWD
jgi:hypothetical protein